MLQRQKRMRELQYPTAFANEVDRNKEVKLNDNEKTAVQVLQKVTEKGETSNQKFKLKNPNTTFSQKNFTLAADQEKELPNDPIPELLSRSRSGFIVKA
jgi:hypothetical protein